MHKMFVGIQVPATVAKLIQTFSERRGGDEGIRWSHPDDLHITLKFIGSITAAEVPQIAAKLRRIRSPSFDAVMLGADVFQDVGVLVILVNKSDELMSLQAAIVEALNPKGLTSDGRVYSPHISVGRWNRASSDKQSNERTLQVVLDGYCSGLPVKKFLVNEFTLYETISGHYRILEKFRLQS